MQTFNIQTFRTAAPYIYAHQGNVFVITMPDGVIDNERLSDLIQDLALLQTLGIKLVLAYGPDLPGNNKTAVINYHKLRKFQQAAGEWRAKIESLFSTGLVNTPMAGMKLTTVSGNFVHARPAGVVDGVDLQFYGQVRRIDTQAIQYQLANGNIVLLPSLG